MRPNDRYVHALNFTLFVGGPDVIGAQIGQEPFLPTGCSLSLKSFSLPLYGRHLPMHGTWGIDPAKDLSINKIIVAGEPGGSIDATRQAIEELWDAKVYDFYGISDIFGACAGMCSERNSFGGGPYSGGSYQSRYFRAGCGRRKRVIRFRTGDIGTVNREKCACGRTHARINITGRLDDMLIVSGVNVFPSDIEYVVRNMEELSGEYRITAITENFTTKFKLEVERALGNQEPKEVLAEKVSARIKARLGVRPREVIVLENGELPRATHKAKRLIDERNGGF